MLIYLACPYSHPDPEVVESRFHAVNKAAARLMNSGEFVFSPITHCHPMAVAHGLPTDWSFWEEYDMVMISKCDTLYVLMLDGWRESTGVTEEIKFATDMNMPIIYIGKEYINV